MGNKRLSAKPSLKDIEDAAAGALTRGDKLHALDLSCAALADPKAGPVAGIVFGQLAREIEFKKFSPGLKAAILAYLGQERVDHAHVHDLWVSMLNVDPAFAPVIGAVAAKTVAADDWPRLEEAMHDVFLTAGLRKIILRNPAYEVFFRNLRRVVLLDLWPAGLLKTKNLPFLCALAEQCFCNEYVYAISPAENAAVETLPRDNAVAVAILGCYRPLYTYDIDPKLSGVAAFRSMAAVQIREPSHEAALAQSIRGEGGIEDKVSQSVRAMYEENPYPRWQSVDLPLKQREEVRGDMLIAGCGTGRTATQAGNVFPNVRIAACDITKRSIAYAMRMAEKFGNTNVAFVQRDIMTLDTMEGAYDFIECSGVLHHMADPVAGWQKLMTRLKPDGIMLICLYSTKAREDIKAVRDYIAQKKIAPTADNIRVLRAEIIDTPDHPLKRILHSHDFYTLSEARDLVFHIQETTYSLLEIREIADRLGLEFVRFKAPDSEAMQAYGLSYPADTGMNNLDNWHEFEQQNPLIFSGMYKMIFKRKGAVVSAAAQSMVQIAHSR